MLEEGEFGLPSSGTAPDYSASHPATRLCTRLLSFAPDYWAFQPTAALSEGSGTFREQHRTTRSNTKMVEILKIVENGPIWLEMG